jgi:large subunit ribosomal protein L10
LLTKEQKRQIVEGLCEGFKKSPVLVLVDYRGLNVEKISELRRKLYESGGRLQVAKNTLIKVALKEAGKENPDFDQYFEGPNAALYVDETGDPMATLKTLVKFAKDNGLPTVKSGLFEGEVYDAAGVEQLSKLPSRKELLGMLANVMQAPITGLAVSLNNIILKLPYAINAVKEKKEG